MVCIAGEGNIVVPIQPETLGKRLRRVALPFVSEVLGTFTQVGIKNALQTILPGRRQLFALTLCYRGDIGRQHVEKFAEVGQRIASHCSRQSHGFFGHNTVCFDDINRVVKTTSLRKRHISMCTNGLNGTIHIVFAGNKHLAQVVSLT